MLIFWIYWGALAVLTVLAIVRGTGPMRRTVATIVIVCAIQFVLAKYIVHSESVAHVVAMFGVDAAACAIITWHPAGRWQSIIGLSYVLQLGAHIGRLVANNPDMGTYWNLLTVTAFLQLLLVGGWWLHGRGVFNRWSHSNPAVATARRQSVGP